MVLSFDLKAESTAFLASFKVDWAFSKTLVTFSIFVLLSLICLTDFVTIFLTSDFVTDLWITFSCVWWVVFSCVLLLKSTFSSFLLNTSFFTSLCFILCTTSVFLCSVLCLLFNVFSIDLCVIFLASFLSNFCKASLNASDTFSFVSFVLILVLWTIESTFLSSFLAALTKAFETAFLTSFLASITSLLSFWIWFAFPSFWSLAALFIISTACKTVGLWETAFSTDFVICLDITLTAFLISLLSFDFWWLLINSSVLTIANSFPTSFLMNLWSDDISLSAIKLLSTLTWLWLSVLAKTFVIVSFKCFFFWAQCSQWFPSIWTWLLVVLISPGLPSILSKNACIFLRTLVKPCKLTSNSEFSVPIFEVISSNFWFKFASESPFLFFKLQYAFLRIFPSFIFKSTSSKFCVTALVLFII